MLPLLRAGLHARASLHPGLRHLATAGTEAGYSHRGLLVAVDGGYCNRNVLRHLPDRLEVIARARGDVRLFRPLTAVERMIWRCRRKYGEALALPKDMLSDDEIPWKQEKV